MLSNRTLFALSMIFLGSITAAYVQTDAGTVKVHDVRFAGAAGNLMSGLLYIPADATAETPAPGILAIHGYINSRETQSGFAIELATRGFVVLALDQTGHGYSEPPAFAHGFGGPDGLHYLRSLPFVDKNRIGLEGHSMGGWAVQMAAAAMPDDYASMVLLGSSTGTFGAPAGTATTPRNLLLVFSLFDEFSGFMWSAPVPADIVDTEKLKLLFGTNDRILPGVDYGDMESGTARRLEMPAVTHPGDHLSREAIGATVRWFERTLGMPESQPRQTWYWKELSTLLALVGLVILIIPLTDMFTGWLSPLVVETPGEAARQGGGIFAYLTFVLVPVVLFFPLQAIANLVLPANPVLPQQITNGVLLWAWGTGLLSLPGLFFWLRRNGLVLAESGLMPGAGVIYRALVVAFGCWAVLYLVLAMTQFLLQVDFRFWVLALKPLSAPQFVMFLIYLPLFTAFFVIFSLTLHTGLHRPADLARAMFENGALAGGGFVLLLAVQYVPLLLGGTLTLASQPLLTIVAFQFVPVLFMAGLVSTFCFRRSGEIYTGAFINSMVITWYLVAGTATQAVPFWL